ncbi:MAG: 6-phosphogluconolactonase [Acidimicrobiia bacterium]
MRVIAHPDPQTLAEAAAAAITATIAKTEGARVSVGLAGGSTPKDTYGRLVNHPVPWERVDLWLSDERWVAHDDTDSNGLMAHEALVSRVPAAFHRPRWSSYLTAADSAAFYEAELRRIMPDGVADLVLLGMGTDGHTASLFPGTTGLDEHDRWFIANAVPQLDTWRLTATATMIQRARTVIVLTAGSSKAEVLAEVLEGPDGVHPIQLLRHAVGEVLWMVDDAAAAGLTSTPVERPSL